MSDLIKERGNIVGCLFLTCGPLSNAVAHMLQLLKHILAQSGLAVRGRQIVFTLFCERTQSTNNILQIRT